MSEEKKELIEPVQGGLMERPDFVGGLTTDTSTNGMPQGMENIDPYDQPLYGKIIQSLSAEPFKPPFEDGDYIVTPDNRRIIQMGDVFHFTPIFAFTEYVARNPVQDIPGLDFIAEKDRDPNSDVGQRALSRDPEVNKVRHPQSPEGKDYYIEYLKSLCFVIMLHDHTDEIGNVPIVHSFIRGEAKYGEAFKRLIKARKCDALWKCRFQAGTSLHQGKGNKKWFGLDVINPEDQQGWIKAEEVDMFQALYTNCANSFAQEGLNVDYSQGMDDSNTVDAEQVKKESSF